jgi:hypothetical protein
VQGHKVLPQHSYGKPDNRDSARSTTDLVQFIDIHPYT